eukprot:scaffold187486_cov28-Tisochrysis_lutea.AAC.3
MPAGHIHRSTSDGRAAAQRGGGRTERPNSVGHRLAVATCDLAARHGFELRSGFSGVYNTLKPAR